MSAFAYGNKAFGFCDRCGFRYPLHELKQEVTNLNPTNMLVCPECWDPEQPQNLLGRFPVSDPQALRNPRPPLGLSQSREFIDSADGSPLQYANPLPTEIGFTDTVTTGAYVDSAHDGWFYRARGLAPIPIGTGGAVSESGGVLSCPWPNNSITKSSFSNWDYYGGGGGLRINMARNRYIRVRMRITDYGTDYTTLNPWLGRVYWGVSDASKVSPYPWGSSQNNILPGSMDVSDPEFDGSDWKVVEWKVGDNRAGVSGAYSSWVQTAALGYDITSLRFDFWSYPDDAGSDSKVNFDIDYINIEGE